MELPVEDQELRDVGVLLDAVLELLEPGEVLVGEVRDALGHGEGLEPFAHPVHHVDLVTVQPRHPRAAPGLVLGETLCLQDPQRLADREPARTEALGDLLLADPLPRADVAGQDRVAQEARDPGARGAFRYVDRVGAAHDASPPAARSNALPPG